MGKRKIYYLIRNRNCNYLQKGYSNVYSPCIGTGIHSELPPNIPENGDSEIEVICSKNNIFWEILNKELNGDRQKIGLIQQIREEEYNLSVLKKNRNIIKKVLAKQTK
jgi:hypothetical protein